MAIVSSTHTVGPAQKDGRSFVYEVHTDQYGQVYLAEYLAVANADYVTIKTDRAAVIYQSLIDAEIAAMLVLGAALTLRFANKNALAAAYRQAYKAASRDEAARLAKWLLDHIDAGDFTDAQVQSAFGLTAGQYTTLKTKWTNLRTAYNAVIAAQGE